MRPANGRYSNGVIHERWWKLPRLRGRAVRPSRESQLDGQETGEASGLLGLGFRYAWHGLNGL